MYILVDIGGTKIRLAGSRDLTSFAELAILSTPKTYEEALSMITGQVQAIAAGEAIQALAAGVPALLSSDKRSIVSDALHIPDWQSKPFASDLGKMIAGPVVLENDAALVGLGEAHHGAGSGASIVMYLTISTGVNAARITDGTIDKTALGFATGRQFLSMENDPQRLADLISGEAIEKRFGMAPRELGKEHPVWEELALITAFGVHNDILHWSPERVVLGGSMMNDIGISVERVQFHLEKIRGSFPMTEVVHSKLGDLGGLWGGLALLKQQKN